MSYLYCFYYCFFNFIPFVYFSVHCTLCIFVFYNHWCLVRINKWMDGWMKRGKGGEGKEREEKGLKPPQSKFSGYVAVNDTTQQNNRTAAYGFSAFSMQIT